MPSRKSSATKPTENRAARNAISRNAERRPGQGSDTTPSSDWLAENAIRTPQGTAQASPSTAAGVPLDEAKGARTTRGQSIEARRGAHKSG